MALVKSGEAKEGYKYLRDLSLSQSLGYYNLAAKQRLEKVDSSFLLALAEEDRKLDSEQAKSPIQINLEKNFATNLYKEVFSLESKVSLKNISQIKHTGIRQRILRAREFVKLGLFDMAKWEFYEVERRVRAKKYKKFLIDAYEGVKAFHRSGRIADLHFGTYRTRNGIKKAKPMWESAYPQAFQTEVEHSSREFSIPKYFVWGVIRSESFYKKDISSPVGAKGLMQIMPSTGLKISELLGEQDFKVDSLNTPAVNVRLGTKYLSRLLTMFEGKFPLAAAGYNAGPHRVERWVSLFGHLRIDEFIEHIPFRETRNYIKKVSKNFVSYEHIYEGEKDTLFSIETSASIQRPLSSPLRESWERL